MESRFFMTGIPDEKLGQRLILILEKSTNKKTNLALKEELFSKIRTLNILSRFEIPKEIYFLDNFIETSSGKIQRNQTINLINL